MLGWIIIGFILALYFWAIDPLWLRRVWACVSETLATCWDCGVLLIGTCLECIQSIISSSVRLLFRAWEWL
jgi:hypothetical protein